METGFSAMECHWQSADSEQWKKGTQRMQMAKLATRHRLCLVANYQVPLVVWSASEWQPKRAATQRRRGESESEPQLIVGVYMAGWAARVPLAKCGNLSMDLGDFHETSACSLGRPFTFVSCVSGRSRGPNWRAESPSIEREVRPLLQPLLRARHSDINQPREAASCPP